MIPTLTTLIWWTILSIIFAVWMVTAIIKNVLDILSRVKIVDPDEEFKIKGGWDGTD